MPIEDVDHLLRNSSQECTTVFIDSSTRNRTHYPTPSEYVVDLEEPIRDVFGLDVLDAVIPNTTYNVNDTNNAIRIAAVDVANSAMSVGSDADMGCELMKLGFASPLRAWFEDKLSGTYSIAVLGAGQALPAYAGAAAPATSTAYYALNELRPITALRLLTVLATNAPVSLAFGGSAYVPVDAATSHALAAALIALGSQPYTLVQAGTSLVPAVQNGVVAAYDVVTYRATLLPGGAKQMAALRAMSPRPRMMMNLCTMFIETGFYANLSALQTSVQTAAVEAPLGVAVSVEGTSASGIDKQNLFQLVVPSAWRLLLCPYMTTSRSTIGFDLVANSSAPSRYSALTLGGAPEPLYASVPLSGTLGSGLTSPGLINLLGAQYVTLRCAEIEQYMGNVGKYGRFSTGIGVFKLLGANEVAQVRFDYVSIIRKPIHPIGRLRRLSLRFETPSGGLFDFKGINHQILVSIKYYRPDPRVANGGNAPAPQYVLNPDYDPDFLRYTVRRDAYAARLDDLGFADDDQRHPDDRPGRELGDDDVGDAQDAEDEADDDERRVIEAYVFGDRSGGRARAGASADAGPSRTDFLRFGVAQQNRVLEAERRLVQPFLSGARAGQARP